MRWGIPNGSHSRWVRGLRLSLVVFDSHFVESRGTHHLTAASVAHSWQVLSIVVKRCRHALTNCNQFCIVKWRNLHSKRDVSGWMLLRASCHHGITCHASTETGEHPPRGKGSFYRLDANPAQPTASEHWRPMGELLSCVRDQLSWAYSRPRAGHTADCSCPGEPLDGIRWSSVWGDVSTGMGLHVTVDAHLFTAAAAASWRLHSIDTSTSV